MVGPQVLRLRSGVCPSNLRGKQVSNWGEWGRLRKGLGGREGGSQTREQNVLSPPASPLLK